MVAERVERLVPGSLLAGPDWPPEDIRRIVDALTDGIFILDGAGRILYLNPAGENLVERSYGELAGEPFTRLVGPGHSNWFAHIDELVSGERTELLGRQHEISLVTGSGREISVELVLSVGMTRMGQPVLIGAVRSNERAQLTRLTVFTEQLLDILSASSSSAPAEQLLSSLCRRFGWDVAALWGLQTDGSLLCRGVWTVPENPAIAFVREKRVDPTHDVGGLAELVVNRDAPVWFTDLGTNERFSSAAMAADGLQSACVFPIRYRGQCLGAVKMLSRTRREPDSDVIELLGAISGPVGAILHALEQASERDALVDELENTQRRLEFLLRANRVLSEASGFVETLDRLAEVAVPAMGDLCLVDVRDADGHIRRLAARHADPAKRGLAVELMRRYPPDPDAMYPTAEVMSTGISKWSPHLSDEFLRAMSRDDRHLVLMKELGFTSFIAVPLLVGKEVRGTVTLVSAGSGRRYSALDLAGVEEFAEQIAGVVERARQFDWERHVSRTLQQSLLPDRLPQVEGLSLSARYLPADDEVEVGGDWYDAVRLGRGLAGLIVGDVQGHDMLAASVMGQLRHGLSLLLSEGVGPGEALTRLNSYLIGTDPSHIATVLLAFLDSASGELVVASAGHPAPVVIGERGTRPLELTPGPPLGVRGARFREQRAAMGDEVILFFTDGLVERRDRHPDEGIKLLIEAADRSSRSDVSTLVDRVLSQLVDDEPRADDVAILAASRTALAMV